MRLLDFWDAPISMQPLARVFYVSLRACRISDISFVLGAYVAYGLMSFHWVVAGLEKDLGMDDPPQPKEEEKPAEKAAEPSIAPTSLIFDPNTPMKELYDKVMTSSPPFDVLSPEEREELLLKFEAKGFGPGGAIPLDPPPGPDNTVG